MKVIDIQIYRDRREKAKLENKISELATTPTIGGVIQIKYYFKEWLKMYAK